MCGYFYLQIEFWPLDWIGNFLIMNCLIMIAIAMNQEECQFISRFKIQFPELHNLQEVNVKNLFLFD